MSGRRRKTILFEDKFNVNIDDFHSTWEIDEVIEKKTGRKLRIESVRSNVAVLEVREIDRLLKD